LLGRSLPLIGLEIRVSAAKGTAPARLASFHVEVILPEIDERHQQGLLRAVKTCLIHNTLKTPRRLNSRFLSDREIRERQRKRVTTFSVCFAHAAMRKGLWSVGVDQRNTRR